MNKVRHIIGGSDGWLRIKLEPGGEIVSVPEYLQVAVDGSSAGRDHFMVLEGVQKGKPASVTAGNLTPGPVPLRKAARLVFEKSKGVLLCGERKLHAITAPHNEIPDGSHPIQIPDFPHQGGRGYMTDSKYAKSWFFLGNGDAVGGLLGRDRYLHTGMISAGCVTVDPPDWTAVYEYLIRCRSNDGRTVGTLIVRK
ncbi:hypothetical protein [Pseudoduganella buxea]|uniref:L,D-transpeptidase family protein n=1 Tax=Pseudoduganella buxea TaxID=1949069 RepID=A0A6I3T3J3_9BURK|nr:hypothetical protein [Pseudoduganella buxea]MTV56081.1 hypothetical protein [Pseudoduganella buxea]GGC00651.1 hypothetical protein GCM10011572_23320 [Pseudoduganella buxea]